MTDDTLRPPESPAPVTSEPRAADFALSFDAVAAQYAMARPSYPPELFDAVEELAGTPLRGKKVVDVGAGTGIATALLRERGADVIAVEPGPGMGAQLRTTLPGVPLVRAYGDALPFADATADLVTYAQSWHWTDPARSVPEALRVLRPGGALALWWNVPDPDVAWTAAQERRLQDRLPGYHRHGVSSDAAGIITSLDLEPGLEPAAAPVFRRLHWTRRIPVDLHLAHLASRSYFVVMGEERAKPVLDDERAHLLRLFPDGTIEDAYALDLTVLRRR
ncbi:methyltransferase domain-containing protein [Streptomyces sp. SID8379]|uniref:class I SAM-dependent methyltransferase n=1 Tax=unclassified Streptomyces TaxID=2593676 RepID=UPI00037CF8E2|nr:MULTISPECIES: class I SAM-dependent methyltransferase [unclassified Streptomyces]MYW70229.1 methyltransferase domain-containing protein [Streptomyces sp. SID8379]